MARNTTKLALAEQVIEDENETRVQNATERVSRIGPAPKHYVAFTFSGSGVTWMRSTNTVAGRHLIAFRRFRRG